MNFSSKFPPWFLCTAQPTYVLAMRNAAATPSPRANWWAITRSFANFYSPKESCLSFFESNKKNLECFWETENIKHYINRKHNPLGAKMLSRDDRERVKFCTN